MERTLLAMAIMCVTACTISPTVLLIRQRHVNLRLRERNAALSEELRLYEEELRHLAEKRLPSLLDHLEDRPVSVPGPLHERELAATAFGQEIEAVLRSFSDAVGQVKARAAQSAKVVLRSMMRTVQSLANEQQLAISTMQGRHDDPEVLADLLKIDHMNAQLSRRAQTAAVLCGSWPGQQRAASSLTDVVRGATSRIRDYLRVRVNAEIDAAVVSRAVEPIVLTVAELLDNAARHSKPGTPVEVCFQEAHNGIAIMIDDAGVALASEEIQRATRLLSSLRPVDICTLGDPPRIGFAAAGVLSTRYGFGVSVDTRSPYGGTRAVVFVPNALLTQVPEDLSTPTAPTAPNTVAAPTAVPGPAAVMAPTEASAAATPSLDAGSTDTGSIDTDTAAPTTSAGLPKRRRPASAARPRTATAGRSDRPSDERSVPPSDERPVPPSIPPAVPLSAPPVRRPKDSAAAMGAWQRGTRSGREAAPPDSEGDLRP